MVIITYIILILVTISNALTLSLCRLNNQVYHNFETAQFILFIGFGGLVVYTMPKTKWLSHFGTWAALFLMVRFSLYSATWGYVAYENPLYLGDGAWTDRLIKTVLYDWLNQGTGALGYLYIIIFAWSVLFALRIHFNSK